MVFSSRKSSDGYGRARIEVALRKAGRRRASVGIVPDGTGDPQRHLDELPDMESGVVGRGEATGSDAGCKRDSTGKRDDLEPEVRGGYVSGVL